MRLYFAPLEGVTNYIFRNAHSDIFSPADKYFSPFIAPDQNHVFSPKAFKDILPENNKVNNLVPQLLTHNSNDFVWAVNELKKLGYKEINLNLGCPSGTVFAKGKGSGFLKHPKELDIFFEEVFSQADIPISVKTRLGVESPDEFDELLEIYNKYPISELIIHPRVRLDYYKGDVRKETFSKAYSLSKNPVVWNGDIETPDHISEIETEFPNMQALMIGRGWVRNPALHRLVKGKAPLDKESLRDFHDRIYNECTQAFSSRKNAMLRMKELWWYFSEMFEDSASYMKKIKKATTPGDFDAAVDGFFRDLELKPF